MASISTSSLGTSPLLDSLMGTSDWLASDLFDGSTMHFKTESDMYDSLFSIEAEIKKISTHDDCFYMDEDNYDDYINGSINISSNNNSHNGVESKVRDKNCMWSGTTNQAIAASAALANTTTTPLSTSASSIVSDNGASMPLAVITGGSDAGIGNFIKQETSTAPPPTIVVASKKLRNNFSKLQLSDKQEQNFTFNTSIKVEPVDNDYEQQLEQHNIPTSKTLLKETAAHLENLKHIPPGTSLLRKSNTQQRKQQQQLNGRLSATAATAAAKTTLKIPTMSTTDFVRERIDGGGVADGCLTSGKSTNKSSGINNGRNNAFYGRPETPHSLDDDTALIFPVNNTSNNSNSSSNNSPHDDANSLTGFANSVDLGACVSDAIHHIDQLSKQLQDMTKDHIDSRVIGNHNNQLDDVLELIINDSSNCKYNDNDTSSMQQMHNIRTSDYDSDDVSLNGSSSDSLLSSHLNEDSVSSKIIDATINGIGISPATTPNHSSSNSPKYRQQQQQQQHNIASMHSYMHSDHSYTRCKDGMDDLRNFETPSDSDEEIDVVSIGDKKLPTNPSDKDRRAIQTKFAHKITNSRVVKNPNGIRTLPPRRRCSIELPYTPASSSPVKSLATTRYPSPISSSMRNQYADNISSYILNVNKSSNNYKCLSEKSRKRINGILNTSNDNNSLDMDDYTLPPMKKCRSKKQQQQSVAAANNAAAAAAAALKRHCSFDESADSIEKRNLHNDMERQRRIGLKNLFDALKKQIPSIKDKERAPKVNILREAAKLCEALTREDEQLNQQKALLREKCRVRQELLASLRNLKQE